MSELVTKVLEGEILPLEFPTSNLPSTALHTYLWRDRKGQFHRPAKMETRHIFYVLAMIWHHSLPRTYTLFPHRKYTFSNYYTVPYMAQSVEVMFCELFTRNDLTDFIKEKLLLMKRLLNNGGSSNPLENYFSTKFKRSLK